MSQIDLYNGDCLEVMQQMIDQNKKVDANHLCKQLVKMAEEEWEEE